MTFDQIVKDIKSGKYCPVYFLHGDEPFYIDKICETIEKTVLTDAEKSFNQVILYGKDVEVKMIVDEARQFPMMSSYRVIILREAQDMKGIQDLSNYLENPSHSTILVLAHKHKKLDKRTTFAKLLDKKAIVFESTKLKDHQIAGWIVERVKSEGHSIEPNAANILAEYLGADLSKITNELDKLCLNLAKGKSISVDDIKEQIGISKDFDVYELAKVVGQKNFTKAALIFQHYAQNPNANPTIFTITTLFGFFNKVLITKYHGKSSDAELAKLVGVPSFYLKEYRDAAQLYSFGQLRRIFQALTTADKNIKGVGSRNPDDASILKDLLISFMY